MIWDATLVSYTPVEHRIFRDTIFKATTIADDGTASAATLVRLPEELVEQMQTSGVGSVGVNWVRHGRSLEDPEDIHGEERFVGIFCEVM